MARRSRFPRVDILPAAPRALCVSLIALAVICLAVWAASIDAAPAIAAPSRVMAASPVVHILGAAHPPGLNPDILTIHAGDSVVFENDASPAAVYSLIAEDGVFASPTIQSGKSWTTTFTDPGSYIYHDPAAYTQVVGAIIVVSSAVTLLPTVAPGAEATVIADARAQRTAIAHPHAAGTAGFLADNLTWLLLGGGALVVVVAGALLIRRRRFKGS